MLAMTTSSIRGWPPRPARYSTTSSSPPPRPNSPLGNGRRRSPSPNRNGSASPPHHDASPSRRPPPRHGSSSGPHESTLALRARRGSSPRISRRPPSPQLPAMPSRPRPSADSGIAPPTQAPADEDDTLPAEPLQLNNISARAALRLLTVTIERHVREGDAALDQSSLMVAAQAKMAAAQAQKENGQRDSGGTRSPEERGSPGPGSPGSHLHDDIPRSHKTPIGSPEAQPVDRTAGTPPAPAASPPPLELDEDARDMQRRILARKFVSRVAPPIPPAEYLQRLHRYCPMSTAVYLTAGLYIERLARAGRRKRSYLGNEAANEDVEAGKDADSDPVLPINSRTVHRLVLGALRIATKALEDLSFPHTRFAKVGGVSDKELTRLEVAILFLAEFRLIVSPDVMLRVAQTMRCRALEEVEEESDAE